MGDTEKYFRVTTPSAAWRRVPALLSPTWHMTCNGSLDQGRDGLAGNAAAFQPRPKSAPGIPSRGEETAAGRRDVRAVDLGEREMRRSGTTPARDAAREARVQVTERRLRNEQRAEGGQAGDDDAQEH